MQLDEHEVEAIMDSITFAIPFYFKPSLDGSMQDSDYYAHIGNRLIKQQFDFSKKDIVYIYIALNLYLKKSKEVKGIHKSTLDRFSKILPPDFLNSPNENISSSG